MSLIRIATANLLESASSVTDTGTPTAGYPITRLYDRNTAREYRITEDVARETIATGGVSAISVNALMIAAGHNVGGLTYTLAGSANGTDYTTVATGDFASGTGVLCVEFTAATWAYWRLTLPTNADVTLTEMLLTNILTVSRNPSRGTGPLETEFNVRTEETSGGSGRFIEYGASRRRRAYEWRRPSTLSLTEAEDIKTRIDALGGKKPFFLCDHKGVWIWGILEKPFAPLEVSATRCEAEFIFREVLG